MISKEILQPFERRIRLMLALRGASFGALVASIAAAVWAVLDWRGVMYAELPWLVLLVLAGVLVGALPGWVRRPQTSAVAKSLDRRGRLKDRLDAATSAEPDTEFASEVKNDAERALGQLNPKQLYPFRWTWVHTSSLALATMSVMIFLFAASSVLPSVNPPEVQSEMKKEGERLASLKKSIFDDGNKQKQDSLELQKLQRDLQRIQKDYEKARIDPKEALLKQEELKKEAAELSKQKAKETLQDLKQAETVLEKLQEEMLKQAGLEKVNMSDMNMSQEDFDRKKSSAEQALKDAQAKQAELQKRLDSLEKQLSNPNLSDAEREKLEKQKELTKSQMDAAKQAEKDAKQQLKDLKLSEEARKTLEKLMNDPLMKEIQKELARLREKLKQNTEGDEDTMWQKPLSKEEIEQMKKDFEEMLKGLEDDDARREYLEKLLESLKTAKELGQCQGLGLGLGGMLGMGGPSPGNDSDIMLADTGVVNKSDPIQGKGSGKKVFAPSERDPLRPGPEMTVEIKAPTFKGTRSSVSYQKVLPSYKQKAESAMKKKSIPKQHQDRVKRYFDSLSK